MFSSQSMWQKQIYPNAHPCCTREAVFRAGPGLLVVWQGHAGWDRELKPHPRCEVYSPWRSEQQKEPNTYSMQ